MTASDADAEARYARLRSLLEAAERDIGQRIGSALQELADPYLVRARVDDPRIKTLASLKRKARTRKWRTFCSRASSRAAST